MTISFIQSKRFLSTMFFMAFVGLTSFAQEKSLSTKEWVLLEKTDQYKIEYNTGICDRPDDDLDQKQLYLRVTNISGNAMRIEWDMALYYGDRCYNCNENNIEFHGAYNLANKESVTGSCGGDPNALRHFISFVHIPNKEILTDFKLQNIKISPIND